MGKRQMERNHRMYEYLFYQTSIKTDMELEKDFFGSPAIETIKQATLLLYGTDSNCLNAGKQLDGLIENASLIAVPGDHNIPIQQPLVIAEALLNFFQET
jgi:esterase